MMLWMTYSSPFARKVRVAAAELGYGERISLQLVDPWTDDGLRKMNPLAKVPTLVLDDGNVLYESPIICDYLDTRGPKRRLIPAEGADRWKTLLHQGLADGAMTAMGRLFSEERKPPHLQCGTMIRRFSQARESTLDHLEAQKLREIPQLGEVSIGCLLGYLDFRWPNNDWRRKRPKLSRWFERFSDRAAMRTTSHS